MGEHKRAALLADFRKYLSDIGNKEKEVKTSINRTPRPTDEELRNELLVHFTYVESRLAHVLEIAKAMMRIEGRSSKVFEDLERDLNDTSMELRDALRTSRSTDFLGKHMAEFMIVRNKILDKAIFQMVFGGSTPELEASFSSLLVAADFLGLDLNWALSAVALQLHEIAIKKTSRKMGLQLDRMSMKKILGKEIDLASSRYMPFNLQYSAFCKVVEEKRGIRMPRLVEDLRKTRANVLHQGYNPTKEETASIMAFTKGLLEKLRGVAQLKAK